MDLKHNQSNEQMTKVYKQYKERIDDLYVDGPFDADAVMAKHGLSYAILAEQRVEKEIANILASGNILVVDLDAN